MTKPDNKKLLRLLEKYKVESSVKNYKAVARELLNGDIYLILPIYNTDFEPHGWKTLSEFTNLKLGIYNTNGLNSVAAFTSEESLLEWAKQPTKFVAMRSKDIFKMLESNNIKRMVVDNVYALEKEE